MLIKIIIEVIIGAIVGSIAGKIMDNQRVGFWKNAALGVVGGFVGGLIGNLIGIGGGALGFFLSVAGACLVIWICRKLKK
jgi:uncharacterized membrane protein YeaQ/YmgE (transglycosylase-associated protein family)